MYFDHFRSAFSLSGNFRLAPKFWLSEIALLFGLSLYLDRTLAQQKIKSKSERRLKL